MMNHFFSFDSRPFLFGDLAMKSMPFFFPCLLWNQWQALNLVRGFEIRLFRNNLIILEAHSLDAMYRLHTPLMGPPASARQQQQPQEPREKIDMIENHLSEQLIGQNITESPRRQQTKAQDPSKHSTVRDK